MIPAIFSHFLWLIIRRTPLLNEYLEFVLAVLQSFSKIFYKAVTSLKRTPRVGTVLLLFSLTLYKTDIIPWMDTESLFLLSFLRFLWLSISRHLSWTDTWSSTLKLDKSNVQKNIFLVETYIINLVLLFVLCRYELMSQCWVESDKRPSVSEIESALLSLMSGRSVPRLTSSGILKQKADALLEPHG